MLLKIDKEILHLLSRLGISAFGLLVNKPAVKSIIACCFKQLVGSRKGAILPLSQHLVQPLHLTAIYSRRKENVSQNGHTVFMGRVNDVRAWRHDDSLA